MNSGLKLLLLLVALGGAAFFLLRGNGGAEPYATPPSGGGETQIQEPAEPVTPAVSEVTRTPTPNPDISRTEVDDRPRSASEAPQGVRGRIVDPRGAPVAGAEVFLFEGHGDNLFAAMLQQRNGIVRAPESAAVSDAKGEFRVGVHRLPPKKTWELRITSDRFADHVTPNLTLFEGKWHDEGKITLEPGLTVVGRVTQLGTGAGVPDATVVIQPSQNSLVMAPTPGREQGITTKTDSVGNYRFDNASPGIAAIAAFSAGHARVELVNQNLRADAENRFDFELPPGKSIAGVVTDGEGAPVPRAKVQVLAISSKTPLTLDTMTDRDGRFEALGLVDGPYQVIVTAEGFVRADEKPVMAGEQDRHIVVESLGHARLKVLSRSGRLVNRYQVWVKAYHDQNGTPAYGNLLDVPPMQVGPRDLEDGWYRVGGIEPNRAYALEVHAPGFAKGYSDSFQLTVGGPEPELTVELPDGGSIAGTLVGPEGRGIGNVRVSTLPNEYEDNALLTIFEPLIPYTITKTTGTSHNNGTFMLDKLAPGTYQLRFEHADYYTIFERGIVVEDGRKTDLGQIRMVPGTQLVGTVMLDGAPAPQIKVQVSAAPDPTAQKPNLFSATAISDGEGRFIVPKRLPPGRYEARAGRQANPFQMIVDFQQTKQEFTVAANAPQYELHFRINSESR